MSIHVPCAIRPSCDRPRTTTLGTASRIRVQPSRPHLRMSSTFRVPDEVRQVRSGSRDPRQRPTRGRVRLLLAGACGHRERKQCRLVRRRTARLAKACNPVDDAQCRAARAWQKEKLADWTIVGCRGGTGINDDTVTYEAVRHESDAGATGDEGSED